MLCHCTVSEILPCINLQTKKPQKTTTNKQMIEELALRATWFMGNKWQAEV